MGIFDQSFGPLFDLNRNGKVDPIEASLGYIQIRNSIRKQGKKQKNTENRDEQEKDS